MIDIFKFSHNRKSPIDESCQALRNQINQFAEQIELDEFYHYFEKNYSLPKNIIKQQMKKFLELSYDYRKCSFIDKLLITNRWKSLLKHLGFLLYAFLNSKRYNDCVKKYELIVEWVVMKTELLRFSKLIDLFGKENVLVVCVNKIVPEKAHLLFRPFYKFYDRLELRRFIWNEMTQSLKFYWVLSRKLNFNLFPNLMYIFLNGR